MTTRCMYCGRFNNKVNHDKRCKECEKQFKKVFESLNKQRGSNGRDQHITCIERCGNGDY